MPIAKSHRKSPIVYFIEYGAVKSRYESAWWSSKYYTKVTLLYEAKDCWSNVYRFGCAQSLLVFKREAWNRFLSVTLNYTDGKSRQPFGCRLYSNFITCRPHVYLEPLQPLSPAFFFFSAALPALSLVAVQPLSPAFFSTALPALSLSAVHPLPDDAQPERLKPPALIRLAMPIPARSFFKSLLSMFFLLSYRNQK